MELKMNIQNFGVINEAEIELNQINIISGKNASGKSTLSKLLYSFLASLSPLKHKLTNKEKIELIKRVIREIEFSFNENKNSFDENNSLLDNFLNTFNNIEQELYEDYSSKYEEIINQLENTLNNKEFDDKTKESIQKKLKRLKELFCSNPPVLASILDLEFGIPLLFQQESIVKFTVKFGENESTSEITSNLNDIEFKGSINGTGNEVFYIDSQQNLNVALRCNSYPHFYSINTPLHTAELFDNITSVNPSVNSYEKEYYKKILDMGKRLEKIINGKIVFDSEKGEFKYQSIDGKNYSMHNSASGIKQIGIFQYLLNNLIIKENSFLIMDEPEVNLHPEWQLKLAEFIVLLSKVSDITFFINSHSPFFIEAIETYSKHYDMDKNTSFYLSEKSEDGELFNVNKIEVGEIYKIYENLGDSFNLLNAIRFEDMGL